MGGCNHACRWEMPDGSVAECYAETVAHRVAQAAYPQGFAHHDWRPEQLDKPLAVTRPSRIFMDSMSDLMGASVPAEQVEAVLDVCRAAPQHAFQLLTKNAPRLREFSFPPNVWVGVSAPPTMMFGRRLSAAQQTRLLTRMLDVLADVDVPVRWMSIEPLSFDIAPWLAGRPLQWAVIGAATNGARTYQPEPTWVQNALDVLDANGTRVFFKGNLAWSLWREALPVGWGAVYKSLLPAVEGTTGLSPQARPHL